MRAGLPHVIFPTKQKRQGKAKAAAFYVIDVDICAMQFPEPHA
jgi:hypothetical protein